MSALAIPQWFDPLVASDWNYNPQTLNIFNKARDFAIANNITPSASQRKRIALLLIDLQKDFCYPPVFDANGEQVGGGTLYVAGESGTGAVDDNVRIAEFIYRNMDKLTSIIPTMDTHFGYQIFFSPWWVDANGNPVPNHTQITVDDIRNGVYVPSPATAQFAGGNYSWSRKQAEHYASRLEAKGKYTLYIWPFHCLLGSAGHALAGIIEEARQMHSFARGVQTEAQIKGTNPWTECYSIFGPESKSRWDGKGDLDQKNTAFIKTLMENDYVIIAGQAASHCVMSSVDDLIDEIMAVDPNLAKKVYVLVDGMSPVTLPDGNGGWTGQAAPGVNFVDFTAAAFKRYEDAGLNLVSSTTPMQDWTGLVL